MAADAARAVRHRRSAPVHPWRTPRRLQPILGGPCRRDSWRRTGTWRFPRHRCPRVLEPSHGGTGPGWAECIDRRDRALSVVRPPVFGRCDADRASSASWSNFVDETGAVVVRDLKLLAHVRSESGLRLAVHRAVLLAGALEEVAEDERPPGLADSVPVVAADEAAVARRSCASARPKCGDSPYDMRWASPPSSCSIKASSTRDAAARAPRSSSSEADR